MTASLRINGRTHALDVSAETPLLWALREQLALTGTKYGCGIDQCGACTVHVINPHNAAEQLEGGVCWEFSHAWMGRLELKDGGFTNTNFDSYPLLLIHQMPQV